MWHPLTLRQDKMLFDVVNIPEGVQVQRRKFLRCATILETAIGNKSCADENRTEYESSEVREIDEGAVSTIQHHPQVIQRRLV